MDRYASGNSKAKWSELVRDMQHMEEPKVRSLPEQKGPQPTAARGAKRENCIRQKGHRESKDSATQIASRGEGRKKSMSDFV